MKNSNIVGYLLLAAVLYFIFTKVREGYRKSTNPEAYKMHCMTCGLDSIPTTKNKGSGWIELLLWLCVIFPGLLYSIWRRSNLPKICPACKSTAVVPKNAPAAIKHREQLTGG